MLRIVAFAAFGGLLVGYDLGLIGGALQGIKVELGLSEGQQARGTLSVIDGGLQTCAKTACNFGTACEWLIEGRLDMASDSNPRLLPKSGCRVAADGC